MDANASAVWRNTDIAEALPKRPLWRSMARGFRGRCPACGEGKLFHAFLKPVAACDRCGEDLSHQRADDAPPYFTIVIVGHIIVPLMTAVFLATELSTLAHLAIWLPLTLVLSLGLLQPIKGALIGLQWALYMHGFDPRGDSDPHPAPAGVADPA